jgi:hypothetical protein
MDVEHPAFMARDELGSQDAHESREDDEVGLGRISASPSAVSNASRSG